MATTDPKSTLRTLLRTLPQASAPVRREQAITLGANVALLALALWQGWTLAALIWPYWMQSVAIGVFNAHRMSRLQRFDTTGLSSGGKPVPATAAGRRSTVVFFCIHYGLFHLVYFGFLSGMTQQPADEWLWIALGGLAFVMVQIMTHRDQLRADARGVPNLGSMMFLPYLRILPIHLTILFAMPLLGLGFGGVLAVLLFGALKTWADHWGIRAEDAVARAGRDLTDADSGNS